MSRSIVECDRGIATFRQHVALRSHQDGADGNFTLLLRLPGLRQSTRHVPEIVLGFNARRCPLGRVIPFQWSLPFDRFA